MREGDAAHRVDRARQFVAVALSQVEQHTRVPGSQVQLQLGIDVERV